MDESSKTRATNPSLQDLLTIYGRKPVLEALQDRDIEIFRLHLARDIKRAGIVHDIVALAEERQIEIHRHSRLELSRISTNTRQDQGVAVDIRTPEYRALAELEVLAPRMEFLALDSVTNPQNVGMIVRTVAASPLAGLILPKRGCARLDGLVIKASAGTLLKSRIYHCEDIASGLDHLVEQGFEIIGLSGAGDTPVSDVTGPGRRVFILGNESTGLSTDVESRCHRMVHIPIAGQVESLNVSAAAAIIAFRSLFSR
ncbi:MAG: RNA methyltransferase [Pseudomonadales bacterium]|nr:RNA methyltransferase [Pseudomonadales bacterium]